MRDFGVYPKSTSKLPNGLAGIYRKNRRRLGGKTVGPVIVGEQVMNEGSFI